MKRIQLYAVASMAVLAACPVGANAAPDRPTATLKASSTGAALSVDITASGQAISLPDVLAATGSAPPAYSKTTSVATYSKTASFPIAKIVVSGKTISDTAVSKTATTSSITSGATSSLGSLSATISSPLLGTSPLITISGANLKSSSTFTLTKAGVGTSSGTASIGSLTINAPLFGISNLKFAGTPAVNKVLFQNATKSLTVYANYRVITMAGGKQKSILTDAFDVHLVKFTLPSLGILITGDIEIASSLAN